jgi:hypothetical protein
MRSHTDTPDEDGVSRNRKGQCMNTANNDQDAKIDDIDVDSMDPEEIDAALGETEAVETAPDHIEDPAPVKTFRLILESDPRFDGGFAHIKYAPDQHQGVKIILGRINVPDGVVERAYRLLFTLHDSIVFDMYSHLPKAERPIGFTMDLGTINVHRPSGHQMLQNERELFRRCVETGKTETEAKQLLKID